MTAMTEFFAMGGYGGYVWTCYAAALLMKGALLWHLLRRRRDLLNAQ